MFDADENNGWAAVWWKNYDDMLSRFHLIPERYGQICCINIARQYADAR